MKIGDKCPKCNGDLILREEMFAFRNVFFTGFVCDPCNTLWGNDDDSILKFASGGKNMILDLDV